MLLIKSIVSQCFGQELILSLVAAALLLTKLENMLRIRQRLQNNCRFVTHPAHSLNALQNWSGVEFLTAALSPSPPNGVPFWREYPALNMDINVVAEGVETKEQLAKLRALKCGYAQGYFFSRPVESKIIEGLLAAQGQW